MKIGNSLTEGKRVRKATAPLTNLKIDEKTLGSIREYAVKSELEINARIRELDEEWDIERVLGTNMSLIALSGIGLSLFSDRKWLALPVVVLGFFTQHALQGWCPPVPFFRSMKFRTRNEINQEKHALKAIRGDYEGLRSHLDAFMAAKKN